MSKLVINKILLFISFKCHKYDVKRTLQESLTINVQETESGSLSVAEQKEPWNTSRSASDERTCSFLRNEYIERLHRDEPVKYMLQMQLTSDKTQSTWNPQLV